MKMNVRSENSLFLLQEVSLFFFLSLKVKQFELAHVKFVFKITFKLFLLRERVMQHQIR